MDNVKYFKYGKFNKTLNKWNWRQRFCTPNSHSTHGKIEAENKKLLITTKTLLADSKLPKEFWPYLYEAACHLQNRTVLSKGNKTPYELHTGKQPDLSHLRRIGSLVFSKNYEGSKLDFADAGIFLGYSKYSTYGTYRIYKFETGKIIETRDVKVMENIIPGITWNKKNMYDDNIDIEYSSGEDSEENTKELENKEELEIEDVEKIPDINEIENYAEENAEESEDQEENEEENQEELEDKKEEMQKPITNSLADLCTSNIQSYPRRQGSNITNYVNAILNVNDDEESLKDIIDKNAEVPEFYKDLKKCFSFLFEKQN